MENQEYINNLQKKSKKILRWSIFAFAVTAILIFSLPFFLTTYNWVELAIEPNEIGDTIGGIVGPGIATIAAMLTFIAFWIQYEANNEQKRQFDKQLAIQNAQITKQDTQYLLEQVESRVFKLIDVYNVNVSQMKFVSNSGELHESKGYFYLLYRDFRYLLEEIDRFDTTKNQSLDDKIYADYKDSLISKNDTVNLSKWTSYEIAYIILYFGVGFMGRDNIKLIFHSKYKDDYLTPLLNYLSNKPEDARHNSTSKETWESIFTTFQDFDSPAINTQKYYSGHQGTLGHYFRQLFMSINYINNQSKLSYTEKWEYAKNFRSLFSNHEQLILFINSISILGRAWELKNQDENKRLITKYDLIRNIPKAYRIKYDITLFYPQVEFEEEETILNPYRENLNENIYN